MVVKFLDETCPVPTLILTLDSSVKTKIKFVLKIFNNILVSPQKNYQILSQFELRQAPYLAIDILEQTYP